MDSELVVCIFARNLCDLEKTLFYDDWLHFGPKVLVLPPVNFPHTAELPKLNKA